MAIVGNIEDALAGEFRVQSNIMRGDLIADRGEIGERIANCKIVKQSPNSTIDSHFHRVDQFQVIVEGGGSLGRSPIDPITVHFTAAYTPYGPIVADDRGIKYMVFRSAVDVGASYLPAAAKQLAGRGSQRRHRVSAPAPLTETRRLRTLAEPTDHALIEREPDGLAAWLRSLPPDHKTVMPDPKVAARCFALVANGSVSFNQTALSTRSCVFIDREDQTSEFVAGPEGAEILFLQFPADASP